MKDLDEANELETLKKLVYSLNDEKSQLVSNQNQLQRVNQETQGKLRVQTDMTDQLQRDVNELVRIREHDQVDIQALEEQLLEQSLLIESM